MKIRTCGNSPQNGSRKAWRRIKNVNGASRLGNIWNFFWRGPNNFLSGRDWWPWTKPCYIPMTRRQSNTEWSGAIAAHPAPKNYKCKNPLEKFSPRFFGIKTASSTLIIFQRPKLSTRSITHLCGAIEGHFKGKTPQKVHKGGLVLARQCPGSPGTCNTEETGLPGLLFSWSPRDRECGAEQLS